MPSSQTAILQPRPPPVAIDAAILHLFCCSRDLIVAANGTSTSLQPLRLADKILSFLLGDQVNLFAPSDRDNFHGWTLHDRREIMCPRTGLDCRDKAAGQQAFKVACHSPRYLLYSNLLRVLYGRVASAGEAAWASGRVDKRKTAFAHDLAIHIPRALSHPRHASSKPGDVARLALHFLRRRAPAARAAGNMIDIKRHHQQRVIVATSGRRNAFVDQLVRRLVRAGLHVDSLNNFSLHGDWSAARGPLTYDWKCGAACLESAVDLAGQFATSERLLLSSASGMGRFLLAWWGAANGNGTIKDDTNRKEGEGGYLPGRGRRRR